MSVTNFGAGDENSVVISVPHHKVIKVRTRPVRMYETEETMTKEIGRELATETKSALVLNETEVDVNNPYDFFKNDAEIKEQYYNDIRKLKPRLVLDIHGAADKGPLFLGSNVNGKRYMREYYDKPIMESVPRPDVDIEFRRKIGDVTSRGIVIHKLSEFLARHGLVVGIEMVYPGGRVIKETAGINTDSIALEITKRVRTDDERRSQLIDALSEFIKWYRTGEDEENIDHIENDERRSDEITSELAQHSQTERYIG